MPPIVIVPDVGSISRLIMRSVVVLPHPDGPIKATMEPPGIDIVNASTAAGAPGENCLVSPSRVMPSALIV